MPNSFVSFYLEMDRRKERHFTVVDGRSSERVIPSAATSGQALSRRAKDRLCHYFPEGEMNSEQRLELTKAEGLEFVRPRAVGGADPSPAAQDDTLHSSLAV